MRYFIETIFLMSVSSIATAGVTLKCDAEKRCDGYLKNCTTDAYSLTVHIEPDDGMVIVGTSKIKADFSNQAVVSFSFAKYTVYINRYEYSATFSSSDEVRIGWCRKVEPAW